MEDIFLGAFVDELVKLAKDEEDKLHKAVRGGALTGAALYGAHGALKGRAAGIEAAEDVARRARTSHVTLPSGEKIRRVVHFAPQDRDKISKALRWGGGTGGAVRGAIGGAAKGALIGGAVGYLMRRHHKGKERRERKEYEKLKGKYEKKKD